MAEGLNIFLATGSRRIKYRVGVCLKVASKHLIDLFLYGREKYGRMAAEYLEVYGIYLMFGIVLRETTLKSHGKCQ